MQYDYIIIGQGICGTWLSYFLTKEGCSVLVVDEERPYTASKTASGIINPVTGRRLSRTWMAEELLPFAWKEYNAFGNELQQELISQRNILNFHASQQMQDAFEERRQEGETYLQEAMEVRWMPYFNFNYGVGETNPCYLVDIRSMLSGWRNKLKELGVLLEENFDIENCIILEKGIQYKGIAAKKIIFCDGVGGFDNPYFSMLPYANNKGEAIIAAIPDLPNTHIYKYGINIVPWSDNHFWIGSTFEWDYTDIKPSAVFRKRVEDTLSYWLKLSYTILDHWASERPANLERRPFVGLHPHNDKIGVFNGMGTKGCSLAPYFAQQFAGFLAHGASIAPAADVARFRKVLSRNVP